MRKAQYLAILAAFVLRGEPIGAQEFPSFGGAAYRDLLRAAFGQLERFAGFLAPSKLRFLADGGGDGGGSGSSGDGGSSSGSSGSSGDGGSSSGDGGAGAAGAAGAADAGAAGAGGDSSGSTGSTGDSSGSTGSAGDSSGSTGSTGDSSSSTGDGTSSASDSASASDAASAAAAAASSATSDAAAAASAPTDAATATDVANAAEDAPTTDPANNNNAPTDVATPTSEVTDPTTVNNAVTPELAAIMSIPTVDPRDSAGPTIPDNAAVTPDADVTTTPPGGFPPPGGPPENVEIHAVIISAAQSPWDAIQRAPGVGTITVVGGIVALGKTPIPGEIPGGGPQPDWLRLIPDVRLLNGSMIPPVVPNIIDIRWLNCPIKVEEPNP
jgi:hypothetical protein